jgi:DNA-3-methyladenine glycosylase II
VAQESFLIATKGAIRSVRADPPLRVLGEADFAQGVRFLADRDEHLAGVVKTYGQPPLWVREPGFPTLVYIILEQQVSLASARAAFGRLEAAVNPLTPRRFLKLTDVELLRIGFSRQKTLYTRLLAESLARRYFNLRDLHELHDDCARKMLITFKGIGRWTADIYLLSALRRPDIWPTGDLALATAVQEVKGLRQRPSPEKLEALSAPWKPWRAVAARLFWHAYLSKRGQKSSSVSL